MTVTVVYVAALRLVHMTREGSSDSVPVIAGAAVGALALAFSQTLWEYATQFTPYVLTVVFTALMIFVMLRWWTDADRDDAWRWLALLAFLLGLDFSVHRTNALLLPAILGWILMRRPNVLRRASCSCCCRGRDNLVGGDIAGGAADFAQLYTRPIASLNAYRTSIGNVFLCSSSTPPGVGVHGMSGYHAARAAMKVLRS